MSPAERSELLIRVDERTDRMEKWIDVHTSFHRRTGFILASAAVTIIVAQAGMIFTLLRLAATSTGG